jgi:hypothetical protein
MSIENGERFIRLLEQDASLRERTRSCVLEAGEGGVEQVSAEAGASCRAYEVVAALVRRMDGPTSENR